MKRVTVQAELPIKGRDQKRYDRRVSPRSHIYGSIRHFSTLHILPFPKLPSYLQSSILPPNSTSNMTTTESDTPRPSVYAQLSGDAESQSKSPQATLYPLAFIPVWEHTFIYSGGDTEKVDIVSRLTMTDKEGKKVTYRAPLPFDKLDKVPEGGSTHAKLSSHTIDLGREEDEIQRFLRAAERRLESINTSYASVPEMIENQKFSAVSQENAYNSLQYCYANLVETLRDSVRSLWKGYEKDFEDAGAPYREKFATLGNDRESSESFVCWTYILGSNFWFKILPAHSAKNRILYEDCEAETLVAQASTQAETKRFLETHGIPGLPNNLRDWETMWSKKKAKDLAASTGPDPSVDLVTDDLGEARIEKSGKSQTSNSLPSK